MGNVTTLLNRSNGFNGLDILNPNTTHIINMLHGLNRLQLKPV